MSTVALYTSTQPPEAFERHIPDAGVTIRGYRTPEHGDLIDAQNLCLQLGLNWHNQRSRLARAKWANRIMYGGAAGGRNRTFLDTKSTGAWFAALAVTSDARHTDPDAAARIDRLLEVFRGDALVSTVGTCTPVSVPTVDTPPAPLDGALVIVLRELTAVLADFREQRTGDAALRRHMAETLADLQGQVRDLRGTAEEQERRLRGVTTMAQHGAELAEALARDRHPEADPQTTFDEGVRRLGLDIPYETRRKLSGELAEMCRRHVYPVHVDWAKAGHAFHRFDPGMLAWFLHVKGYPVAAPPTLEE